MTDKHDMATNDETGFAVSEPIMVATGLLKSTSVPQSTVAKPLPSGLDQPAVAPTVIAGTDGTWTRRPAISDVRAISD